jgi:hypothetical protein
MLTLAFCTQEALARDRDITVTTPNGTYTKSVEAGCAGGTCSRSSTLTGRNGGTITHAGECDAGWRLYSCSGTVTGPDGNSVSRHTIGRRYF